MYAHQVIEDLKSVATRSENILSSTLLALSSKVKNSQKFYLGHTEDISSMWKVEDLNKYFSNPIQQIRLPYRRTYVEVSRFGVYRTAFLFEEISENLFTIYSFNRQKLLHSDKQTGWVCALFCVDVSIGLSIDENVNAKPILNPEETPLDAARQFLFIPLKGAENLFNSKTLRESDEIGWFGVFCATFLFGTLACKNIGTIDNEPSAKLNKSRIKKGKQPIFTYKTLVIKPTSKRQQGLEAQGLWENRIHLCRGHFKEYTEAKPLFGRYTGRYWWQPSVRGRNTDGVVLKDYEVKGDMT